MHDAFEMTWWLGRQLVVVDAHDDGEIGAVGRGGDDDLLGAGLEVFRGGLALGEDAGAFERDVDPELFPRQLRRVALGGDADLAAAGVEPVLAGGHLVRIAAVDAVVAQQVRVGLDGAEIVDARRSRVPGWRAPCAARKTSRPIRPKPLIATLIAMFMPLRETVGSA